MPAYSSKIKNVVAIIVAIGITIALFSLLGSLVRPELTIATIGFAGAIITASFQYRAAKDKETEARLFAEKQAIYTELTNTIMDIFQNQKEVGNKVDQNELAKKLRDIRTKLIIWGSFDTLKTLDQMGELNTIDNKELIPISGLIWLGNILSHMRKDLGHKDPEESAREIALGFLVPNERAQFRSILQKGSKP